MEMNILNPLVLPAKEDTEVQQKKQQEYKLVGRARRISGHTMFSYNMETGEVKRAILETCDTVLFNGKALHPNKIQVERNCYYEQALNEKNFIKRLKRNGIWKSKY